MSNEDVIIICSSDDEDVEDVSVQPIAIKKPLNKTLERKSQVNSSQNGSVSNGNSIVVDITTPTKQQTQQRIQDLTPQELLELRRKKIDQQIDLFERCQQRLSTNTHLMNPEQLARWERLSRSTEPSSSKTQATNNVRSSKPEHSGDAQQPSTSSASHPMPGTSNGHGYGDGPPTWRRPPWFIDPPSSSAPTSRSGSRNNAAQTSTRAVDDEFGMMDGLVSRPAFSRRSRPTKFKRKRKAPSARRKTSASSTGTRKPARKTTASTSSGARASSSTTTDRKPKLSKLQSALSKIKVKKEH